ncbi:DNA cytosine methyltransferase [Thalassospira xiamenensis]|uniref:Cytosine-specific methyltransferase n=1 Tax=Thalassospira xiamenensis TaxID=220697 RepID=A0A285TSS5_9PROT|nr:DNA cytosine methyltransferase [Thalassospira xiamenensis]SOC26674.1 DNA (cytosine-5)-methyltransferase 1 [Thalassospira xiamenensis]
MPTFYEFFAGGGLVSAALTPQWSCLFANDVNPVKALSYSANFESHCFVEGDMRGITLDELPGHPELVWASFPCQDLSVAGPKAGISGKRSGLVWPFLDIVMNMAKQGRRVPFIILENVVGTLTSNNGKDYAALLEAIVNLGYRVAPFEINASLFVPQSRPRLFIVCFAAELEFPQGMLLDDPTELFVSKAILKADEVLSDHTREHRVWLGLPPPVVRTTTLSDILEPDDAVTWKDDHFTVSLLNSMSASHAAHVKAAILSGGRKIGTVFRRTRMTKDRGREVRAEVRFDGIAGCLRTPSGGSSKQLVLVIENGDVKSRFMTPRECARLMGLSESYRLPSNDTAALHITGDGVVVPVVQHLVQHCVEPLLTSLHRRDEGNRPTASSRQ